MNVKQILKTVCVIALVLPMLASAEIYKWKDKNGVMRYSDTPPPASVQVNTLGKKSTDKPANVSSDASEVAKQPEAIKKKQSARDFEDPALDPEAEAARIRASNAEAAKKNKIAKEKEAKADADNCKTVRANYQAYTQGGRMYKMNEKGERVYMGDAELAAGKAKAQAEMNKYCK